MSVSISAICCTFGRVPYLEECIAAFLAQDYLGPKQLIILNTYRRQRLHIDIPNVKIVNLSERPSSLGKARNIAIELADHEVIVTADDDDFMLPNHLSSFAEHFTDGIDWVWLTRMFYAEQFQVKQITKGTFNVVAYRKSAWKKVGEFSEITVGEDRQFVSKLTEQCQGKKADQEDNSISFVYAWGQGSDVYHVSGHGMDQKGMPPAHQRIEAYTDDLARKGIIPTGDIALKPCLRHDYAGQVKLFISKKNMTAPVNGDVCIVGLGRFGDICNALPIALHIHNTYRKPYWMVSREFASILDGVSYVEPYVVDIPFDTLQPALDLARRTFSHVIQTQIWARDYQCERQTDAYNKESWRQAGFLDKFSDWTLPPMFDQRDKIREAGLVAKLIDPTRKNLLVNVTRSFSSPFPFGNEWMAGIKQRLGSAVNIIDISALEFHRIYDLIGLMDAADGLVCIDTAPLHLSTCSDIRVVAITNNVPWLGTAMRPKPYFRTPYFQSTYSEIIEKDGEPVYMAIKGLIDE